MALMQERIDELAHLAVLGRPEAWPFCREIRQIRFNAWHYVDTSLWASLAATLFDELARADAPDETETKLTELDNARDKAEKARMKRQSLEREVGELVAAVDRPTAAIRASVSVTIRAVRKDPKLRKNLENAAHGETVDDSTARLISVIGDIDSATKKARVIWRLFQEEVLYRRRRATLVALIVVVGLAVLALAVTTWSTGVKLLTLIGALVTGCHPR